MRLKKCITSLFIGTVFSSVIAVSAYAYNHSYYSGYSYTDTAKATGTNTTVLSMREYHLSPYVYTSATNKSGSTVYMEVAAFTYKKNGALVKSGSDSDVLSNNSGMFTSCSDYRSTSTNVYYKHTSAIYGNTNNPSASNRIASLSKTVG